MKLKDFLELNNLSERNIISYSGEEALEAVKENGYALQYVDKSIFDNEEMIIIDGKKIFGIDY